METCCSCCFTPNNRRELLNAVHLWCSDKKKALKIYGHN